MPNSFYTTGLKEVVDGTIRLGTDTLKLMLVNDDYVFDSELDAIDNSEDDTSDPSFCELDATNYTAGHGGAGRKTATISVEADKTEGLARVVIGDVTWTALGGTTNDVIGGAILVKENANDAAARPIAFFEVSDLPTNGGDITLDFAASGTGNITFSIATEE